MAADDTTQLQQWIDLLNRDFATGREALLTHAYGRIRRLTATIINTDFAGLHGNTEDVLQDVMIRLHNAMTKHPPKDVRALFGLAGRNIRWALLDLARGLADRGEVPNAPRSEDSQATSSPDGSGTTTLNPTSVLAWTDFQRRIDALPDDERTVVEMIYFLELSQAEAAIALNVPVTTVQSRWRSSKAKLALAAKESLPGFSGQIQA